MHITEVFQEYYFTKIATSFNSYIVPALAKDIEHYSYVYIEITFEHGGTAPSSMRPTGIEIANALFLFYKLKKDLLKLLIWGVLLDDTIKRTLLLLQLYLKEIDPPTSGLPTLLLFVLFPTPYIKER